MAEKWNFEKIWDRFSELPSKFEKWLKDLKEWFSGLFNKEVRETKKNLNSLSSDLIDEKINLTDEKISDEEKKILDKIKELDKNDKYIENWLNWIDWVEDDNLKIKEQQSILSDLQKEADDDNDKKWDLDLDEFKEIWKKANEKYTLCDNVLKKVEKNNSIPEEKRTKKVILEAYNNWLTTETDIIKNLENSIEQPTEEQE